MLFQIQLHSDSPSFLIRHVSIPASPASVIGISAFFHFPTKNTAVSAIKFGTIVTRREPARK